MLNCGPKYIGYGLTMAEAAAIFINSHYECPTTHYLRGAIPGRVPGMTAETLIPLRNKYSWIGDDDDEDRYDYDDEYYGPEDEDDRDN